jgi:hypothetical protein
VFVHTVVPAVEVIAAVARTLGAVAPMVPLPEPPCPFPVLTVAFVLTENDTGTRVAIRKRL